MVILCFNSVDISWDVLSSALRVHCLYGRDNSLTAEDLTTLLTFAALRNSLRSHQVSGESILVLLRGCHFVSVSPQVITTISISRNNSMISLQRYDGRWRVFVKAATAIDEHLQTHVSLSLKGEHNLVGGDPSWFFDFSVPCRRFVFNSAQSTFVASSRPFRMMPLTGVNGKKLMRGVEVDKIQYTGQYLPPRMLSDQYNTCNDNLGVFLDWYRIALDRQTAGHGSWQTSCHTVVEFAETIQAKACGHLWEPSPPRSDADTEMDALAFLEYLEKDEVTVTDQLRIFCAACLPSFDRKFGVTQAGWLCLLPRDAEKGDMICIFEGNRGPIVLRRPERWFINIGECFVHGIMHGEAADLEKGEPETYVLA